MEQGSKIVVSIDAIGCNIYFLPSDFIHPDAMFTPGGVDLIDAVDRYIEKKHNLQIGRLSANILLKSIGSVAPLNPEQTTTFDSIELSSVEVRDAIALLTRTMIHIIVDDIQSIAERRHISSDYLLTMTISLCGEFNYLKGFDQRLQEATGLKVVFE